MFSLPVRRTLAVVFLLFARAVAGFAQVKTGPYIFTAKGSNSLLRLSANGLLVVDSKLSGSYDDLVVR